MEDDLKPHCHKSKIKRLKAKNMKALDKEAVFNPDAMLPELKYPTHVKNV